MGLEAPIHSHRLNILLGAAIVIGFCAGIALKASEYPFTPRQIMLLNFPGELFLRMLQGVTIPLVMSSIITAIGNLDLTLAGKIGRRVFIYYMSTTVCASIIGIILVSVMQPGKNIDRNYTNVESRQDMPVSLLYSILDVIRNCVPDNIVKACISTSKTRIIIPPNITNLTDFDVTNADFDTVDNRGPNVLGILVFSLACGIVLALLPKKHKEPLLKVAQALMEAMMFLTVLAIHYSPIGVAFLIIGAMVASADLMELFSSVGLFSICVVTGLAIQFFITYGLLFRTFVGSGYFKFMSQMSPALITSFGTASSQATMPVSIQALIEAGIDKRIAEFMVPFGATVNMDGSAVYQTVTVVFFAQLQKRVLTVGELIVVSICATLASVGIAGIPSGGLIALILMTSALGIPPDDIALVAPIDWILDRLQTSTNVYGDAIGCAVINACLKSELK